MTTEKQLLNDLLSKVTALLKNRQVVDYFNRVNLSEIEQSLKENLAASEKIFDETCSKLINNHRQLTDELSQELFKFENEIGFWCAPWDSPSWHTYMPDVNAKVPYLTRIGKFSISGTSSSFDDKFSIVDHLTFPATLPIIGGKNLLLKASKDEKILTTQALQSLVLRLISTMPAGKFRLLLIDPVGLGRNVAGFLHLADYMDILISGKPWIEANHIEQRLVDCSEHMENVIQKYLRNRYSTMEEYNLDAGEVAEPYRLIVIMNFPVNFTEAAAKRLVSIASNGPRCGVYLVATVDTEYKLPYGFNLEELERVSTVISYQERGFIWQEDKFKEGSITLDEPPPNDQFERIVKLIGAVAKSSNVVQVPFERIIPKVEDWWKGDASKGIRVAIGRVGARSLQNFDLGDGMTQHALIAGRTGSGKSNLLHVIINGLATTYSPNELEMFLIDFKKGVEFKIYATHQLPNARVIAIESEREFGLSVLLRLDDELTQRGEAFRSAGANNISEYRQKTGVSLSRILLLVDEFQEFFTIDDALATQATLIFDRIARQGRAFGIHLLLGSQTLAGAYSLAHSTINQMAVRIALQCSDSDSRLILADDNPAARLLSRPGEAVYNPTGGLIEGNTIFQTAWISDEIKENCLKQLHDLALRSYPGCVPPLIFEGSEPANLANNQCLNEILLSQTWNKERNLNAWIGEPISIKLPTAIYFHCAVANNFIVIGRDEKLAVGMITAALISIAAQCHPDEVRITVLDLVTTDTPWAGTMGKLSEALPHKVQMLQHREIAGYLAELDTLISTRQNNPTDLKNIPIFFIIQGIHRAREIQRQDDFSFLKTQESTSSNISEQFSRILKEGPEVNIHVIAWCDTYANCQRKIGRESIQDFGMRAALSMSAEESNNFLDNPLASKLDKPNRSIYYDDERIGIFEKFRPYQIPNVEWLARINQLLQGKLG